MPVELDSEYDIWQDLHLMEEKNVQISLNLEKVGYLNFFFSTASCSNNKNTSLRFRYFCIHDTESYIYNFQYHFHVLCLTGPIGQHPMQLEPDLELDTCSDQHLMVEKNVQISSNLAKVSDF